jgi:hypothetical protein
MDRRLFNRSAIEVDGEITWTTRRFGREKTHAVHVKTLDLSVDGAKLIAEERPDLAVRSTCRLSFRNTESDAIVLELAATPDGATLIRLAMRHPPADFLAAVEQWLPTEFPDARPLFRPEWAGG